MLARSAFALTILLSAAAAAREPDAKPPNIVFILADDLGWGDLGVYGQRKTRTPNIDRLAAEGMRFTYHYAGNAVCAPSRCVFLTGKHPGHAFVRDNANDPTSPAAVPADRDQVPLPDDAVTLAEMLSARGYATGGFGKWGLGGVQSSGAPLRQGFERFFGYTSQGWAHNYYPIWLWDDDKRLPLDNPDFSPRQKLPAEADPRDPASYARYRGNDYAPDLIAERARQFVRDSVNDERKRPFFLYWPTIVPHLALQVPEDSLAEYLDEFPDEPYLGDHGYLPHRAPRAAYAAMITRMDREVGRMMELLKELGIDQETLVIFTSDNGGMADALAGLDPKFFNITGGLRGGKGSLYEGGIRVPAIVRWPGKVAAGVVSERVTGFEDWLPTLIGLAGGPWSDSPERSPRRGLRLVDLSEVIDGISFVPTLLGRDQPKRPFLYREFAGYGGWQSVRMGDWKGVRHPLRPAKDAKPNLEIELYDLATDPAEERNVAAEHPDIVRDIEQLMRDQHIPSAEFPIPVLDGD